MPLMSRLVPGGFPHIAPYLDAAEPEDRFNGSSVAGTALCFLVCMVMVSFPSWLSAGGESLAGQGNVASASLAHGDEGADCDAPLGAVLTVVGWVCLLAFLRGVSCCVRPPSACPASAPGAADSLIGAVQPAALWQLHRRMRLVDKQVPEGVGALRSRLTAAAKSGRSDNPGEAGAFTGDQPRRQKPCGVAWATALR